MVMVFETKGKKQGNVHYVDVPGPYVVEENFGGYFLNHEDYALAEELQNQETMYLSLQGNVYGDIPRGSSSSGSRVYNVYDKSIGQRNSSRNASLESQLAFDEAIAREMQELENQLADGPSFGEVARIEANTIPTQSSIGNTECNPVSTSSQVALEDDIDPDNMTYEELQQLGETIGTESKGLPEELISLLPSSTYRKWLFSKYEECVICCMAYKNRDELVKLPCQHQYHKECITKWLKINKACPVCNEEVFG